MNNENSPKKHRKRWGVIFLILLNMLLCLALIAVLVYTYQDKQKTVTALQTTIDAQEQRLAVETIPLSTFQEKAARYNPSAEFIQSFFSDRIIYKDETGIVYAPIDESLPKNSYNWDNLVRVNGRFEYQVDGEKVGKVGIDVSKYQGEIDWEKVKADGIDFAILRVGVRGYETGKLVLDETFERNIKAATAAGMDVGVYFFSQAVSTAEALEEAQMVIENLEGYRIAYPVILDIEDVPSDTARTAEITREQNTDMAIAFCEAVKEAGYTPMLYANTKWFVSRLDMSRLTGYGKWLAQYYSAPFFPYAFDMWQYSSTGKVDGITGDVDLNVCFTDFTADESGAQEAAGDGIGSEDET